MNKAVLIREIAAVYQKHGWTLRRLLLTEDTRAAAAEVVERINVGTVLLKEASLDAMWFSRVLAEREAWELRLVQAVPFALFESFDRRLPEPERERKLEEMEIRLKQQTVKRDV